jgi:hypothetical protein
VPPPPPFSGEVGVSDPRTLLQLEREYVLPTILSQMCLRRIAKAMDDENQVLSAAGGCPRCDGCHLTALCAHVQAFLNRILSIGEATACSELISWWVVTSSRRP